MNYFTFNNTKRVHWRATRQSNQIHLPAIRTQVAERSFVIIAVLFIIIFVHVNYLNCLFFLLIFLYILNIFIDTFDIL